MTRSAHPHGARWSRKLLALLTLTACAHANPETPGAPATGGAPLDREAPLAKENANPRLLKHSNFFKTQPTAGQESGPSVYHLRTQHWPLAQYPAGLTYEAYSAVGYDLANTILLLGPRKTPQGDREWIIIDTLGSSGAVSLAIPALRAQVYGSPTGGPAKLPIAAIIYTHNHIDHTGGVNGYITAADRPPCPPENPQNAGQDGYLNVDGSSKSCIAVLGQENITSAIVNTSTIVGSAIDPRSAYMYGNAAPLTHINSGIGPQEGPTRLPGTAPQMEPRGEGAYYYMPSRTMRNKLNVTAAGINLNLMYVPSETNDEIAAFLPDRYNVPGVKVTGSEDWTAGPGLLQSAEVIQGPSFPNLYSLRGTSFRDPSTWYASVDVLRSLNSWCMVPSHGPPLCEHDNIELLLRSFRDAIQFSNDQALRYINQGYTQAELPQLIKLPAYITEELKALKPMQNEGATPGNEWVDPQDYLTEFYGSVSQGVREIYSGKLGFFQADPVQLRPTPQQEAASRTVKLMGGTSRVYTEALAQLQAALGQPKGSQERVQGLQWAAELATLLIRAGTPNPNYPTSRQNAQQCLASASPDVIQARQLKATAFANLAEVEINPNWRNWYAASSRELTCELILSEIKGGLVTPTIITGLPGNYWVQSLGWRLKAEETTAGGVRQSLGFYIRNELGAPGGAGYMLAIRRAVAPFIQTGSSEEALKQKADVVLSMERAAFDALIIGDGNDQLLETLNQLAKDNKITVSKGTLGGAQQFLQRFDPKPVDVPVLSGR